MMKNKNMKKITIYIILIIFLVISLSGIIIAYGQLFPMSYFERIAIVSISAGLLGSVVYMTRGFYQSIAEKTDENKMFDFNRWIWWYLCRPIMGAIAGLILFIIIYLAFDLDQTDKNILAIFLTSFLSGYNFHEFIEKRISKKIEI